MSLFNKTTSLFKRGMIYLSIVSTAMLLPVQPVFADGMLSAFGGGNYNINLQNYLGESGHVISRAATYEYGPAVIKMDNDPDTLLMWFCGGGNTGQRTSSNTGGDSIWFSRSDTYGQTWSTPVEVIRASNNYSYLDSAHACDPSVIRHGDNYYVFYTGSPDWRSTLGAANACADPGNNMGCDNRIFVARVPVWAPQSAASYQKAVNVGECYDWGCFQWKPFWSGTEYPPIAVVRYEDEPVWRLYWTGTSGKAWRQTMDYGIGQPSALNIGNNFVMWHTNVRPEAGITGQVDVWQKETRHVEWAWNIQDKLPDPYDPTTQFRQFVANVGNEVNYDVAYSSAKDRYIATVAKERNQQNPPLDKPCVHVARQNGYTIANLAAPFIDNNLGDQPECALIYTQPDGHNDGFLRNEYGYLVEMPGHAGGPNYDWIYYGTSDTNIGAGSDIVRTPFSLY